MFSFFFLTHLCLLRLDAQGVDVVEASQLHGNGDFFVFAGSNSAGVDHRRVAAVAGCGGCHLQWPCDGSPQLRVELDNPILDASVLLSTKRQGEGFYVSPTDWQVDVLVVVVLYVDTLEEGVALDVVCSAQLSVAETEPRCCLRVFDIVPPFAVRADLQLDGGHLLGVHAVDGSDIDVFQL